MHGFLNIDKPAGLTSHDVVARVRRLAGQRRVGHAGTLDPAATGVLIVALGGATRLIEYVQDETSKRYLATVRLGVTTTTDDAEGEPVETRPVPALERVDIETAIGRFVGLIQQVPPMYSALHHEGRRLHELARRGVQIDLPARTVHVERIDLLSWESQLLTLDVLCGKGTYIRSLARDLGAALGCGGHLAALRRTAVGSFRVGDAVHLDTLTSWQGDKGAAAYSGRPEPTVPPAHLVTLSEALLPPETAVADWPRVDLGEEQARRARNGLALDLPDPGGTRARAHAPDGTLLALLTRSGGRWHPEKVFDWAAG